MNTRRNAGCESRNAIESQHGAYAPSLTLTRIVEGVAVTYHPRMGPLRRFMQSVTSHVMSESEVDKGEELCRAKVGSGHVYIDVVPEDISVMNLTPMRKTDSRNRKRGLCAGCRRSNGSGGCWSGEYNPVWIFLSLLDYICLGVGPAVLLDVPVQCARVEKGDP